MLKAQVALQALGSLFLLCTVSATASPIPPGWVVPSGWHIDASVKHATAEGDLTGTGLKTSAVLLTNGRIVRLVVFVNYRASDYKAYRVFEEPQEDLKSDDGISVVGSSEFELEPGSIYCSSKWIHCTADKRIFFHPPMPALWLAMGDWGGSVFRWTGVSTGFDRFSVGD